MRVERHVADQRDDLGIHANPFLVFGQVLAQLGREGVEMGVQGVEVSVLIDQLRRRLLPDPRDAGQVVRGVPPKGGEDGVQLRANPGPRFDPRLVIEGVVADPTAVVEHPDVGILDELVGVAVAGDQQDVVPAVSRFGGQRGQHVVGLEPLDLDDRDGQLAQQRTDHLELGQEVGRRLRSPRLVVLDHLVPEGFSGQVEGDGQAAGMVVADQVVEHRREPVDGIGHDAGAGGQIGRQRKVSPEGEGHAVEQEKGTRRRGLRGRIGGSRCFGHDRRVAPRA